MKFVFGRNRFYFASPLMRFYLVCPPSVGSARWRSLHPRLTLCRPGGAIIGGHDMSCPYKRSGPFSMIHQRQRSMLHQRSGQCSISGAVHVHSFPPTARSPASPSPGTMYLCSLSVGSTVATHSVKSSDGKKSAR